MLKKVKSTIAAALIAAPLAVNVAVWHCNYDYSPFWDHPYHSEIEMLIKQVPVDLGSNFSNIQLDHVWNNVKGSWSITHA